MKKLLIVLLVVMALSCLLAVTAFAADKLLVKDANGQNTVFVVQDTGTTGIGTGAPESQLTVVGPTFPAFKTRREVSYTNGGRGVAAFELKSTGDMEDGFGPSFEFWISDDTFTANKGLVTMEAVREGSDTSGKFILRVSNNGTLAARLVVNSAGNVGIGTMTPAHLLQVGGAYTDGNSWYSSSSREYKENIHPLSADKALEAFKNLNPVTYVYKTAPEQGHVGFIAEEVPDLIAMNGRKSLSPLDIVAVLTKVVQEQNKTIAELSDKMKRLEAQVARIKSKDIFGSVDSSLTSGN